MTEKNEYPEMNITVESVEASELTLIGTVRADLQTHVSQLLTSNDVGAHVIVSVVGNGVFVACIIEDGDGRYRFGDLNPESIYELWQLKTRQYDINKGAWFSVQFRTAADGFVVKTSYNYDKEVFSGSTPEQWYIAPEIPTELYKTVWTVVDYQGDMETFVRKDASVPDWLK